MFRLLIQATIMSLGDFAWTENSPTEPYNSHKPIYLHKLPSFKASFTDDGHFQSEIATSSTERGSSIQKYILSYRRNLQLSVVRASGYLCVPVNLSGLGLDRSVRKN